MRDRSRATVSDLRNAVDCLPRATKIAMLNGINSNEIIVGAYTGDDGICPMLAAHRHGGRTSFISFAKAWDAFAFRDARSGRARRATERELLILRTQLEASLSEQMGPAPDLRQAMVEHRQLLVRREEELANSDARRLERERRRAQREAGRRSRREHAPVRPGDPDRSRELRNEPGWAWTRVVRRYDDYERALQRLETEHDALRDRDRELVNS
jgi:hypothetical protein